MKYKILDKAQATILLLKIISEEGILNKSGSKEFLKNKQLAKTTKEAKDAFILKYGIHIGSFISHAGTEYFIENEMLSEIIEKFQKDQLIEIIILRKYFIREEYNNLQEAFAGGIEFARKYPDVSENILLEGKSIYDCVIEDIKKVKMEFSYINKSFEIKSDERKIEKSKKAISYDDKSGYLFFNDKAKIKISKSKNTNQHYLLKTLFKNKTKIWSVDEIKEDQDPNLCKEIKVNWKSTYFACRDVNEKVAMETLIPNFILFSEKTVCINTDYI